MRIVDLSQEIYHRMPVHPAHPPAVITTWVTHEERAKETGGAHSSTSHVLMIGDHVGTHVDAFKHMDRDPGAPAIDEMPLDKFCAEGLCLDLRHIPPKGNIEIADLEAALKKTGLSIQSGDAVLLCTGHHKRTYGTPEFLTDFSGLTRESATWLGRHGISLFGVEAVSPGTVGANNYAVHRVCAELRFTHIENLCNLEALLGQGRFLLVALPLKIRGGSGSPVRAVAIFRD